ncbi:serine hydrolase domain-containing protein [Flindersiella endophytica]
MNRLDEIKARLDGQLPKLLPEYDVPAMAIAVSAGDELVESTTDPDAVFMLCSITKVWTATLVMQLVDDGLVELDAPVRTYLPRFRVADQAAGERITIRHLLAHTAGFDDPSPEGPASDDAIRWYVEEVLPTVPQLFPPGALYSYGTGYVVLGRVVEVLRGQPYNEVLRERLAEPLGLERFDTRPDWNAPSGTTLSVSAGDLARFAHMHLRGGVTPDGTRILSETSVRTMREPQVELPRVRFRSGHQGLGWKLSDWPGGPVPGHGGGGPGQESNLQTAPAHQVAIAGLSHGGSAHALFLRLFDEIFGELTDVRVPMPPGPPPEPAPLPAPERYTGRYEALRGWFEIETCEDSGQLLVRSATGGPFRLAWLGGDRFTTTETLRGVHVPYAFAGDTSDGRAAYFHTASAFPRVD